MTSKQALNGLLISFGKTGEKMFNLKTGKAYTIGELVNVIQKDLEILEIIKRHYKDLNGFNEMIPEYTDDYEQDIKDFCKLEEWLNERD